MQKYQIVVMREKSMWGCALNYTVELDGIYIDKIKNGKSISMYTTPGPHILTFSCRGKPEKSISIMIDDNDYLLQFSMKFNIMGKIQLERENGSQIDAEEKSTRNKWNKHLTSAVICVVVVIVSIFIAMMMENTDSRNQKNANEQLEEMTEEDRARMQLEEATKQFEDGDYVAALDICEEIVAQYPMTSTAMYMDTYLGNQYVKYPNLPAVTLMSEYESNLVNADLKYTDQVLIVSGTVTNIGKTNHDSNISVLLKSGTYLYGVQLNFKTSQAESVAKLREGDSVTAIGRCTGKSGKALIIFDGNNVMIENCYLINT